MTVTRALAVKELRVLLPVWAAAFATIVVAAVAAPAPRYADLLMPAAIVAYTVGAGALGALAAGQDYLFGTLAPALALPVSRRRMLVIKVSVLLPFVVSLAAAFLWALRHDPPSRDFNDTAITIAVLFCAVCLCPWLTIVTRNLLAGALFGLSAASLAALGAGLVTQYGFWLAGSPEADALRDAVFAWTMAVACAAGAVLSWRAFMRLEAIEGPGAAVDIWRPFRGRATAGAGIESRPGSSARRLWLLVVKELHVQQLSFTLAALFVLVWGAVSIFYARPALLRDIPGVVTPIYFACLALLVGVLSSAEERQMGMAEVQALLPVRMRLQWMVKAGVTLMVGLLLSLGIPFVLFYGEALPAARHLAELACGATLVVAFGMYVSSLSGSGVRALAYSLPAGFVGIWYVQWVWRAMLASPLLSRTLDIVHGRPPRVPPASAEAVLVAAWMAGMAALLVVLAFNNHRTLERGVPRLAAQIAGIAVFGVLLVGTLLLALTR